MEQRYRWCLRRLFRTWWLLRRQETRRATTLYLASQGAAYGRTLGRDALRVIGSGGVGRAGAR